MLIPLETWLKLKRKVTT